MIPRNITIHTSRSQVFSTASDNQPSVEIHTIQGDKPKAADNETLARFILNGIRPAPRGMPRIEVAFDIDANGILTVTAQDKDTGRQRKMTMGAVPAQTEQQGERVTKTTSGIETSLALRNDIAPTDHPWVIGTNPYLPL